MDDVNAKAERYMAAAVEYAAMLNEDADNLAQVLPTGPECRQHVLNESRHFSMSGIQSAAMLVREKHHEMPDVETAGSLGGQLWLWAAEGVFERMWASAIDAGDLPFVVHCESCRLQCRIADRVSWLTGICAYAQQLISFHQVRSALGDPGQVSVLALHEIERVTLRASFDL